MTVRTRTSLASDLSTGGSNNDTIETRFMVDLLDSVALDAEITAELADLELAAEDVTVAEGSDGLAAGDLQTILQALATRIQTLEDAV
jgi:hypothetical protein